MKAGLLTGLYALAALRSVIAAGTPSTPSVASTDWLPVGRLVFIVNPDEEIGSPVSTPVIAEHAVRADVALVLEAARENGDIVSSRKGHTDLRIHVQGRAAHAGVEPHKGRSAVLEAAHKIVALHELNGQYPGVTVNAGVVRGGTRPNIVAESAIIEVDVRAVERRHLESVEAAILAIAETSTVPEVLGTVEVATRHWPMERTEASARLVEHAIRLAAELGFTLREAATGGASDGNTTAGLGVPTIDGLGPIGGLDHAPGEYIEVDSIVPRMALLAGLLRAIGDDPHDRKDAATMPDDTPRPDEQKGLSPATLAVWAGEGGHTIDGATQVPVVYSAAYGYPDVDEWLEVALGRKPGHIYSRNTNPTVHAFEEKVRILEGGAAATSFSTGMAAISNTLFALLRPGDRVVSVKDTYGGTNRIFLEFLPRIGIEVDLCDTTDHATIEAAIAEGARSLYLETPTNPTLKVLDIAAAGGGRARRGGRRRRRQHLRHAHQPEPAGPRAPIWSSTAPRSSWAATPTRSVASSSAMRRSSRRSSTSARSPARRSTRWPRTCSSAA